MTLSWFFTNLLAAPLLPPFSLLILGGVGLLSLKSFPRLGRGLIALSMLLLMLLSLPIVSSRYLETLMPTPVPLTGKEADAIVILGGGRVRDSVEYGGDTLKSYTLERVRYGAHLARKLRKPVLVTGGAPEEGGVPEGRLMGAMLREEYGIPVRWVEDQSLNTWDNARYSGRLLAQAGIRRIYLVTHAWHLARAMPEFQRAGLTVVPAGTGYRLRGEPILFDFIPSAMALQESYLATHEWIGRLWYRMHH